MPFLPSLSDPAHLSDLFTRFPRGVQPLMAYTDAVLRADGELSIAERELIATYTSALNACTFCYGAHKIYAEAFGISEEMIETLVADLDAVEGLDKLKPILRYVQKLNTLPAKIITADAQAVYDAGWSEEALYEATQVCALFNMMNRIIEGAGVNFNYAANPETHSMNRDATDAVDHTYSAYGKRVFKG
ncbi:MAG: peroxidase-related enzyme [Paracoccaceae bacterium]